MLELVMRGKKTERFSRKRGRNEGKKSSWKALRNERLKREECPNIYALLRRMVKENEEGREEDSKEGMKEKKDKIKLEQVKEGRRAERRARRRKAGRLT